jgi:glutamate dehydrogenase (NAD(P)+)
MVWMLDEFETIHGGRYPGFITGKPVEMGGSQGRKEATGYGVVYTIREALRELGMRPEATRASVQGFGNVGQHVVDLLARIGVTVGCVSTWDHAEGKSFTFRRASGVHFHELMEMTDRFGAINQARAAGRGYEILPGDAWIDQEVDILVPAALEHQITGENAHRISERVRIVAEAANGPTTVEGDEVLARRGIFVIPDFLANAGGVTCSYFEQVQSNMNYFWEREEVLAKLDAKMIAAFHAVYEESKRKKVRMREAAYLIAVNRVAHACRERGWV